MNEASSKQLRCSNQATSVDAVNISRRFMDSWVRSWVRSWVHGHASPTLWGLRLPNGVVLLFLIDNEIELTPRSCQADC